MGQARRGQHMYTALSLPMIPSISQTPASPHEMLPLPEEVEVENPPAPPRGLWYVLVRTWHILFPSLHHFKSKTLIGKIVSLLAAPAVMALTITLPVVIIPYGSYGSHEEKINGHETRLSEFEEEGVERALIAGHEAQEELREIQFNKWLTAVQCIIGPLFMCHHIFQWVGFVLSRMHPC